MAFWTSIFECSFKVYNKSDLIYRMEHHGEKKPSLFAFISTSSSWDPLSLRPWLSATPLLSLLFAHLFSSLFTLTTCNFYPWKLLLSRSPFNLASPLCHFTLVPPAAPPSPPQVCCGVLDAGPYSRVQSGTSPSTLTSSLLATMRFLPPQLLIMFSLLVCLGEAYKCLLPAPSECWGYDPHTCLWSFPVRLKLHGICGTLTLLDKKDTTASTGEQCYLVMQMIWLFQFCSINFYFLQHTDYITRMWLSRCIVYKATHPSLSLWQLKANASRAEEYVICNCPASNNKQE